MFRKKKRLLPSEATLAATKGTSIFHRRHRLQLRHKLLHAIVLGQEPDEEYGVKYRKHDNKLLSELEAAHLEPHPRPHTPIARVLLRYCFHVADYFPSEKIAAVQPALLDRVSNLRNHPKCQTLWEDVLQLEIRKSYNRFVKTAALDFILNNGQPISWTLIRGRSADWVSKTRPRATERHKPMVDVRRNLSRKLCIHHFYGRKFLALWYKFIKPIDWCRIDRLQKKYWEMDVLKRSWEEELGKAEQALIDAWQSIIKHVVKYAQRQKVNPPSQGNVTLICRTLDTLIGLLLLQWREESMNHFCDWLIGNFPNAQQNPMMFVTNVMMKNGHLVFDPPVEEINSAWGQFCDLLSVAAYRALQSSSVVFDLIRQQQVAEGPIQVENVQFIKVKTPPDFLDHARQVIKQAFSPDKEMLTSALEKYLIFAPLLTDTVDLDTLKKNGQDTFDYLEERITHYRQVLCRIETDLPPSLSVGRRYHVQLIGLKNALKNKIYSVIEELLLHFSKNFTMAATLSCKDYAEYADIALTVPQTTAQWIYQRDRVTEMVATTLPEADTQTRRLLRCFLFMCDQMQVAETHSALAREVIMWKRRMSAAQVEHGRLLKRKRTELEEALKLKRERVVQNVTVYSNMMETFQRMGDIEQLGTYVEQARSLLFRLEEALSNVTGINEEERHFGWDVTEYPLLGQVREKLTPFLNFFEISTSFLNQQQQWLDSRLGSFDPDAIVRETETFATNLAIVEEQLPDISDVRHVLGQVETKLRDFNKVLPLIRTLGNPALRERHWEQIWETVGVRLSSEAATSLQQLLALQLNEHLKKIEIISYSATQEMSLENALLRMKNLWISVTLPIESYRVGEGKVLGKVDSIQLLVEDHMMETQIMRRSPYVKPFEKDAREWEQQLNDLQVLLEHCVFIQDRWCSLEPLLTSPDVLSIAPEEARKFSAIDKNWRDVLSVIGQCKQVFSLLFADRISERLNICIQQIQQLEKNLHNLMENKRLQYPRFFLLAEDELKQLLSLSRDPHRFATSLWRLYEGVADLEFTPENEVTHVVSSTGERLQLKEAVSYTKCKGQLDRFLNQLESVLRQTLSNVIAETVKDFTGENLEPLMVAPSQIVVLTVQIYCTSSIDAAFDSAQPLTRTADQLEKFLETLHNKFQSTDNSVHKSTAESIALVAHYYKDLFKDLMEVAHDSAALAWEACYKFRWIDNRVQIHVMDMVLDYGMEYIGRPAKMIGYRDGQLTGLTMANALTHHLAGILVGSAPRIELLENLSNVMGQRMITLDCSHSLSATDILRQIRGATTCGIWLCYRKLEALKPPVVTYMTSLIVQLQNMAATTPPWLELIDSNLPQYGVFCLAETAAYHQRRFDSNVKKAVNVVWPDTKKMAEILFPTKWQGVMGFMKHYRQRKQEKEPPPASAIETLRQIAKSARRYNLNRALLSWLSASSAEDEVGESVRKLCELMPGDPPPPDWRQDPLVMKCESACQTLKLKFSEQIKWKLSNLIDALEHARLPVLLYGPRLSGKTTLLHIMAECMSKPERSVQMHKIFIGAYTGRALMNDINHSIIPQMIRQASADLSKQTVIVLSGSWMDEVHGTLLEALSEEGRGILCLKSTEQMSLPENIRWVFETNGIENVTPGQSAQCRLIYLDGQKHLTWRCLFDSWISTLAQVLHFIEPLLSLLLPSVLQYVEDLNHQVKKRCGFHQVKVVKHLLKLIKYLTDPTAELLNKKQIVLDADLRSQIQASVIFCTIWTMAAPAFLDDKDAFNEFFNGQLDFIAQNGHLLSSARPPQEGSVFDYKLLVHPLHDGPKEKSTLWHLWAEDLRVLPSLSRDTAVNELFILTTDSARSQCLMTLFISGGIPCILIGPRASGKTATARHYMRTKLNKATHQVIIINACKALDARMAQKVLMGQMERRRKGVYGPTLGKKAVIFFDDMQTETMNEARSNRVDMLLRQCIQNGQIYDVNEGGASSLIDIDFVATTRCGYEDEDDIPETVDHAHLQESLRSLKRNDDAILLSFATIPTTPPTLETASSILHRMLMWHLDARGFAKEFDAIIDEMIDATMAMFKKLINCQHLAAYPRTLYCKWNLRDLMRCIHGLLLSVPETIEDVAAMKRLWLHEACRVYSDRLPSLEPVFKVAEYVEESCLEHFKATVTDLFAQMDMVELADIADLTIHSIFFCDFSDPKSESRSYVEVMDMDHLAQVVRGYVTEYNNMNKKPMHYLIVFRHLMRSLSRASRVLKQPSGHLILVGPKGVGRHTLARLAGHASDCHINQYDTGNSGVLASSGGGGGWSLSEWIETFKQSLISAAEDEKRSLFICSDVEFERQECRALINHVVAHGDVMYLFDAKERGQIIEMMRAIDLQKEKTLQTDGTAASLKSMFETRMWEAIRIIIVLSSEQYSRTVMNECPQIAAACQTVWLHPWPEEAIEDLTSINFKEIELEPDQKSSLMNVVNMVYQSMTTTALRRRQRPDEDKCQQYGLFMDFIQVSVCLTREFRAELSNRRELCCQAVEKLALATERVAQMEGTAKEWKDNLQRLKREGSGIDAVKRTERDIEMISCQIDRAKDLLSSLSVYNTSWSADVNHLSSRIHCCQTDSTLTAAALVLGAQMNENEREESFKAWTRTCLTTWPNSTTFTLDDDYTVLIKSEVHQVEAAWLMANLPRDYHCIRSAVSLRHVQRVPLLIDPHSIVEKWIDAINANKENRPTYLHMSAPDYLEQLAGALQLGTVVVLDITQTELDPAIIPLVLKQTFSQGSTNYIKLGADVVEYAGEFQLYLRSQTPVSTVDLPLWLSVTSVDLSLELPGIYDTLVSALVNSERPDTEEKIQLVRQMSEIRHQLEETEQSLLNILSHSESDWIENDAVITSLLPAITQSKLLKEKMDVLLQTRERMESQRQSFAPTALLATQILSRLWVLERIFPRFYFPLNSFAEAIVSCLEDGDGDGDDFNSSTSSARKLAARLFNRRLKPSMDRCQRLLVALLLACSVAQSERLCKPTFIQWLGGGLEKLPCPKPDSKEDDDFVPPDNNWTDWVDFVSSKDNRWCLASSLDKLSTNFLKVSQNVEFSDYAVALADVNSSTPVVMFAESGVDLLVILSKLCRESDFPEDRVRFSAVAGLETLNWIEVEDCVRRGNWLVLQGFAYLGSLVNNVRILLEHLSVDNVSAEFKLFILWDAFDSYKFGKEDEKDRKEMPQIPCLLLQNCRSIYVEHVHTAEACFQEFIHSSEFDKLMNDPLRTCASYPLKLRTAALLLVLRVAIWDRMSILFPLNELWQTFKQIGHLTANKNLDWSTTFCQVTGKNLAGHLPPGQLADEFTLNFLPDLVENRQPELSQAVDAFLSSWSSAVAQPIVEFDTVSHLLVSQENERKREAELSEKIWNILSLAYASSLPADSFDPSSSADA